MAQQSKPVVPEDENLQPLEAPKLPNKELECTIVMCCNFVITVSMYRKTIHYNNSRFAQLSEICTK